MRDHQFTLYTAIFFLLMAPLSAAEVQRVEPPNWWQGFQHQELQLLVYGDDIGRYTPSIAQDGISVSRVERVASPNYLFVYLDIADTAPIGTFEVILKNDDEEITFDYELRKKNPDLERTRGFSSKDTIYLLTPDRFANGDPQNDSIPGMADALNPDDDYGRHGGDLAGIEEQLDYIAGLGFTQIWMNPVLENRVEKASYHGYSTTNFYKVDPRFGDNGQYQALVESAREKGVGMIMDMIVNHIGDGHWWMEDLPTNDWLNFQADPTMTSHARTVNFDAYASDYDRKMHTDGWFVPTMPDLNQRNPLLADYLVQNALWWIETLGLSGIRQDTWPYPDKEFMSEWARRIMQEYPHFNIVGEEWSTNPVVVSYWQRGQSNRDGYVSHLPSLFDFPLQDAVTKALLDTRDHHHDGGWWHVYNSLANDILYPNPESLVIFADNHDMDRIFTQLHEDYAAWRMATVMFATLRGIPQFFYGTEILMSHTGTSSHGALRMDMPGGFDNGPVNAFTGEGLPETQRTAQEHMRRLLNWRKSKTVLHDGDYMHYAPIGPVFVYFRYTDDATVMVVLNKSQTSQRLDLERFYERIDKTDTATDVLSGKSFQLDGALLLEPRSVLLLEVAHDMTR